MTAVVPVSRERRIVWTVILAIEAVGILALLIFGAPDPKLAIIRWGQLAVLSVAGGLGWVAVVLRPWALDPRIPLAVLLVVVGAVPATLASPYPSLAWPALWLQLAAGGTLLLIWHQAADPAGRRNLLALLAMVLIAIILAYLATVAREWAAWLAIGMPAGTLPLRPGNLGGLLPIPTWLGDAIVAVGPVSVVAIARYARAGRVIASAILVLALVAIALSGTRSIWLLLPLGVVIVVVGSRPDWLRRALASVLAAAAVLLGTLAATGMLGQIVRDVDEGRSSAFASAIRLFAERPLFGGGPGTYGIFRVGHDVERLEWLAFPSAHNIVLNALAETGIVGGVTLGIAVVLFLRAARSPEHDPGERSIRVAAAAGLVMLLGHALVDVVFEQPGLLVLGLAAAGLAVVTPKRSAPVGTPATTVGAERPPTRPPVRVVPIAAILLGVAIAVPALRIEAAVAALARANDPARSDAEVVAAAREATTLAPDFAPAWTMLTTTADRAGMRDIALDAARRTRELDPLAQHDVALAWLALGSGDPSRDVATTRLDRERRDPLVHLNRAVVHEQLGGPAAAIDAALLDLIRARPDIGTVAAGLPPRVRAAYARAADQVVRRLIDDGAVEVAFVVALTAADSRLIDRVVIAAGDDPLLTSLRDAARGDEAARARVEDLVREDPRRPWALWLMWYLAARACDDVAAGRWEDAFRIQYGQTPVVPVDVGPVPDVNGALRPTLYPEAIWKVTLPSRPYVTGTWLYRLGTPSCG